MQRDQASPSGTAGWFVLLWLGWVLVPAALVVQALGTLLTFFGELPTAAEEAEARRLLIIAAVVAVAIPVVGLIMSLRARRQGSAAAFAVAGASPSSRRRGRRRYSSGGAPLGHPVARPGWCVPGAQRRRHPLPRRLSAGQNPISRGEVGHDAVEVAVAVLHRADEVAEQLEADRPEQRAPGEQRAHAHRLVQRGVLAPEDGDGVLADQAGVPFPGAVGAARRRGRRRPGSRPARCPRGRRPARCPSAPGSRAPASRRAGRTRADAPAPRPAPRGRPSIHRSQRRGRRGVGGLRGGTRGRRSRR